MSSSMLPRLSSLVTVCGDICGGIIYIRAEDASAARAAPPAAYDQSYPGGLILNGITQQDIQDQVGLYFNAAGQPYFLPPNWVAQVKADGTITSNNVPGTWGQIFYLHGPHLTYTDIGLSKSVPITQRVRFRFQVEMLNAFNHPTFAQSTTGLTSTGFGRASQQSTSRRVELRGNVEF